MAQWKHAFACVLVGLGSIACLFLHQVITPEEIVDPNVDEHSVMTYLSQFPKAKLKPGAPLRPKLNPKKARAYGPGKLTSCIFAMVFILVVSETDFFKSLRRSSCKAKNHGYCSVPSMQVLSPQVMLWWRRQCSLLRPSVPVKVRFWFMWRTQLATVRRPKLQPTMTRTAPTQYSMYQKSLDNTRYP